MSADQTKMTAPQIISRDRTELSPWVTLETVSVARNASTIDKFYAFRQADYVHVFTMTPHGTFVLVQQYRPIVARWTIEFPGGLRDPGESPEIAAGRELSEETGYKVIEMVPLIESDADVGRLCNKYFGFFALADKVADPEAGIATVLVGGATLHHDRAHRLPGSYWFALPRRRPSAGARALSAMRLSERAVVDLSRAGGTD
jgi:8-oxo-dGTP pyrophosphatase MutT (NUDIX family)